MCHILIKISLRLDSEILDSDCIWMFVTCCTTDHSTLNCRRVALGHYVSPEVIKLFSCSAQLRLKFILLLNVKMPTVVGILTFINRINYCRMGFMPEFSTDSGYFSIYELLKIRAQLS